ncbi:hypothetical protein N4R57_06285 [Rhodobacteraceae bacterium D3-12]|nr:hypothetical protein N4R57_06285 [Rhodobacteraceae bacterium D3-12]
MKQIFLGRATVLAAILATSAATSAQSQCASEAQTFLSCTLEKSGKTLSVCVMGNTATYRFGPKGAPELTLSTPLDRLDYRPWNGVGSSIWEEVRFANNDVTYAVYGSILRMAADDGDGPNLSAGVEVLRGETSLANLSCDQKSVVFPWNETISDAKRAAGLTWDRPSQSWRAGGE